MQSTLFLTLVIAPLIVLIIEANLRRRRMLQAMTPEARKAYLAQEREDLTVW